MSGKQAITQSNNAKAQEKNECFTKPDATYSDISTSCPANRQVTVS